MENIMECIWTDKSYYNKGFLFLGLNEPDIDDLLKVAKPRQITAYGTGIFCYYIVSTHTMYTCILTITSVPRVRQIYKCEEEILMLLIQ